MTAFANALSETGRQVRTFLAIGLKDLSLDENQILIGPPSVAARGQDMLTSNAKDLLNLFFYRIEHDGFPTDGSTDNPTYVRAHCLMTAFCVADADPPLSAGEKELRLVGRVMQVFHENPCISIVDDSKRELAELQVVPTSLSVTDINHLWGTQGELPYRLSFSYEFALLPVPFVTPVDRAPRVGSFGLQVGRRDALDPKQQLQFHVDPVRIDVSTPDWAPAIRWITQNGSLRYALAFQAANLPQQLKVAAAGVPGTTVDLVWEQWDKANGWQLLKRIPSAFMLQADSLDATLDLNAPNVAVDMPPVTTGQLQLSVQRLYSRPDGAILPLSSNPLLVSVYGANPS
jgi:hypothetical protein